MTGEVGLMHLSDPIGHHAVECMSIISPPSHSHRYFQHDMPFVASDYVFGVAAASLGMQPQHTIEKKWEALQQAGFSHCEIGFGNYMEWVRQKTPELPPSTCPPEWCEADEPDPSDDVIWQALMNNTDKMKALAQSHGLKIICVQPLNQFDGWPVGSTRGDWVRRKALRWLQLCSKLGVEFIQVGSNDKVEADGGDEKTAKDMRWLAQVGASQQPPVKIAYENWCFSKRLDTWEHAWKIVQMADHPNLGLCLDTAQFPLNTTYGWDATTGEGWTENDFQAMLQRLRKLPAEKIVYVELSDVLAPVPPLYKGSLFDQWAEETKHPRGDCFMWAMCGRPLPLVGRDAGRKVNSANDMGGARVVEVLKAIFETGYKGYLIFEMFEALSMQKADDDVPIVYANACSASRERLIEALSK